MSLSMGQIKVNCHRSIQAFLHNLTGCPLLKLSAVANQRTLYIGRSRNTPPPTILDTQQKEMNAKSNLQLHASDTDKAAVPQLQLTGVSPESVLVSYCSLQNLDFGAPRRGTSKQRRRFSTLSFLVTLQPFLTEKDNVARSGIKFTIKAVLTFLMY